LFLALITSANAATTIGLTPWVYIGSSTTFLDGDYVDELETTSGTKVENFKGTIVGFSLNKQWENNLILGVTFRNAEKGYIVKDVDMYSSFYYEAILSFGYAINIPLSDDDPLIFLPYIGLGSSAPFNTSPNNLSDYLQMSVGINIPLGVAWIMGIDYSIGFGDAVKDKDSKYNNLNFTLGHKF